MLCVAVEKVAGLHSISARDLFSEEVDYRWSSMVKVVIVGYFDFRTFLGKKLSAHLTVTEAVSRSPIQTSI